MMPASQDRGFLSMNAFHTVSSATELIAGASLLCCPSIASQVLIGTTIEGPAALTVARVAGAGLLALGIACGFARNDVQSCAAKGLMAGMLVYDILVAVILTSAGLGAGLNGVALWPAVILHLVMSIWGIVRLSHR